MSTIKADAIAAVSTNGDLSLDGLGTGGVSIASTLKMTKGGDISSASPLVIDTDGNYFDVTGTTNFAAMTVESGNFFMLQFDGALTITHGSGIELPGASNLTTAAGDRLVCYATAANTVEVMSVELETAASAGFTLGTKAATTSGSDITIGSIPAGTTVIIVSVDGNSRTGADVSIELQLGDSGGIETSSYIGNAWERTPSAEQFNFNSSSFILMSTQDNTSAAAAHGQYILTLYDSSSFMWSLQGQQHSNIVSSGGHLVSFAGGTKTLSAELTQIKVLTDGTFDAGAVNITYI
jgi:hypothetical protein